MRGSSILDRLLEPPPSVTDPQKRMEARLLASLLFNVLVIALLSIGLRDLIDASFVASPVAYLGLAAFAAIYAISRTRYYRVATYLTLVIIALAILAIPVVGYNPGDFKSLLAYLVMGVLLSSILTTWHVTIIYVIFILLGIFSLQFVIPQIHISDLVSPLTLVSIISALILVITRYRNRLETARQAELSHLYQEVQSYAAALEDRVRERTSELEAANAHLLELSAVKDDFVANVSHELRTPITNLKLYQRLLREATPTDPGSDKSLSVLERETRRLELIIEDLLTLSRLDQNRPRRFEGLIDLNQVIGEYVSDRQLMASESNLTLRFVAYPDLPPMVLDPGLVGQMIGVLVTNAMNYTPPGGSIEVRTLLRQKDGAATVGIEVRDTGIGIPPEEHAKVFGRFYRGQAGRQSGVPGTGLGLSIVSKIAAHHGGGVEIESAGIPGEGACVCVHFPVPSG